MRKSRRTLTVQLEIIDAALLNGSATKAQEKRGLKLVSQADAAPVMLKALRLALPLLDEFADMGDSKTIRRAARLTRQAIAIAEGSSD